MRIKTKLILSIFPVLLVSFASLSLLSFSAAKDVMRADAYRYIETVLNARYDNTFKRRTDLLRATKMDQVRSFLELYQKEALDDLESGADSEYGCFRVYGGDGTPLFVSSHCPKAPMPPGFRKEVLNERHRPEVEARGMIDAGMLRVWGARYFEPWDWTVVYSVETSRFEKAIDRVLAITLVVAGLSVFFCGLIMVVVLRRVFELPIVRLKGAAKRIAAREPDVVVELGSKDELGDLAASLNEMSADISRYIDELQALKSDLERSNESMKTEIAERRNAQTELMRSTEMLRKSEESLSRAVDSGNVGLWDWEIDTGAAFFSSVWKRQIGYEDHEIDGHYAQWESRLHPDDRDATLEALKASQTPPWPPYMVEFRFRHKDGSYRWILAVGAVELDSEQKPARMLGSHVDITQRKEAEEEKRSLQEQLAQAQKMESVGRLAGGVAHDFNNMLSVILGRAELALMDRKLTGEIKNTLDEIVKAGERSTDLARQLLAFARKQAIAPKVIDLSASIDGIVKMLDRLIGENLTLDWTPNDDLWPVKMDPSQIDQVLTNLCVNARDAISDVGRITIAVSNVTVSAEEVDPHSDQLPGDYVRLTVSDTGHGMDEVTRAHAFEPFFTTKAAGVGSGLGLATVYGIVKQNGGQVRIESAPGRGTSFEIDLPRSGADTTNQRKSEAARGPALGGETILVVEDEEPLLETVTMMLEKLGYNVLAASTARRAIELAARHAGEIKLLLTDVVMPQMNGKDLAAKLVFEDSELKCLFMSSYTADIFAQRGILEQDGYFIQKPFDIKKLSSKITEVLGAA